MLGFFQGSRARSEPVHLYRIEYGIGSGSQMLLSDAEGAMALAGDVFQPVQIRHGEINASGTLDKANVEVNTPRNNPLVELFRAYPPSQVVNLTIYRGEVNDPDAEFVVIWSGRIIDFSMEGNEARFVCEPIATSIRRPGLRRNYQYGCPHVLYGPSCRANKLDATVSTTVSSIDGSFVILPAGWFSPFEAQKFRAGLIEWTAPSGDKIVRSVLRVTDGAGTGRTLLLGGLPVGLVAGQAVAVSLGCNHQMSDCKDLHNNILNFGGCPWIPVKNPIGNYNNFY